MLRPELADKVRPFPGAVRPTLQPRSQLAKQSVEQLAPERLDPCRRRATSSIIKTAAVRLLAFGNGRSTAAPAGHADIRCGRALSETIIPSDTVVASSGAAPSGGHERARTWPIEPATEAARAPRPASRIKQATAGLLARGFFVCRLPRDHPSGQLRQAFRLQLRGQLRVKTPSCIPFSLLIFEETVHSATKGRGRGTVNAPPADRACDGGTPVYSSGRRRFPHYERDARRERGEERKL